MIISPLRSSLWVSLPAALSLKSMLRSHLCLLCWTTCRSPSHPHHMLVIAIWNLICGLINILSLTVWLYLRLTLHQEIHLWYCKPGQKPVAVEAISASREAAATVLLVDTLSLPNCLLDTYFSAHRLVLLPAVVSRGSSSWGEWDMYRSLQCPSGNIPNIYVRAIRWSGML